MAIGGGAGVFTLKPHLEALVALYAFSLSGYLYVIKTHLMDLCKARHFALAYSASNLINGVGLCSSLPISGRVIEAFCFTTLPFFYLNELTR